MLDRCEETMHHTSRSLLCWLRSTRPHVCYPKPFTLVAHEKSQKKYRQLWKRFLAFVFRLFRMPISLRRRVARIRFTKEQLGQLQAIWEHEALNDAKPMSKFSSVTADEEEQEEAEEEDVEDEEVLDRDEEEENGDIEDEEDGVDSFYTMDEDSKEWLEEGEDEALTSIEELLELLFQLSITFSTEDFIEGQPGSSLLVYYSGILGFSSDGANFLPAKRFTPYLSGLVYIQRLLFLEHALPYRAYPFLGIPRRTRLQQHEQLDEVRQKYMVTGSPSALEELQSLRDFGRGMAREDPPSFLLRWSDDGQMVFYEDAFSLTMQDFCRLSKHFLDKAAQICDELMFDLHPPINLVETKDDMANTETGFSFVSHPGNRLADAYLGLSTKACTTRRGGLLRQGRWDWKAIFLYQKKVEALEEMLVGSLHTSCGQVPRGPELFSLECQNGPSTQRGIYVWNGSVIYITRHHKAKRSTNREFHVVRFMPVQLGHVMYKYLVYIRPFTDMLRREQSSSLDMPIGRLLFQTSHARNKPWDSGRLTAILKKATAEVWGKPINSQLYRQLSIGISERHVREIHKPFNRYDDKGQDADLNVVFAWQSGHRPLQRGTTYGLDGAFPTKLQPTLLRAYEWASTRWHEFIHQPSKVMPQQNKTKATKSLPESRRPLPDLLCGHSTQPSRAIVQPNQAKQTTTSRIQESLVDLLQEVVPQPCSLRKHNKQPRQLPWNETAKAFKRLNHTSFNGSPRAAKRRTLPWLQSRSYAERGISLDSISSMQGQLSSTDFTSSPIDSILDWTEADALWNKDLETLRQMKLDDPQDYEERAESQTLRRRKVCGVLEQLERWLKRCPSCHSCDALPRSYTFHPLHACSEPDVMGIQKRSVRMQEAMQCNGWECCTHCGLDLSDLEDVSRSHHKKDGDEWVCEYKGVMTALIATVIKDGDPRIQRMV
jgi:hypothetical protein